MSSGEVLVRVDGGVRIFGAGIKGSLRCASPSTNTDEIWRYLAAFLSMDAIQNIKRLFTYCGVVIFQHPSIAFLWDIGITLRIILYIRMTHSSGDIISLNT
jgi:hypothetical protein